MVTIELTNYQARKLKVILKADLKDFEQGILALDSLEETQPQVRIGGSGILPVEALFETRAACSVIQAVIDQLNKEE